MIKLDAKRCGDEIYQLISDLYPICRSITGNGVRETLEIIGNHIPLRKVEVPTGTQVFDWVVPKEWNIRDAYIKDSSGRRIVDFHSSNLHVVSYSVPVRQVMTLTELKKHLFSLPEHPDWIPYRTSYYNESWGFCISHNQLQAMEEGEYEVVIDSTLDDGSLTYGEAYIAGDTDNEILVFAHTCHPSLCNDNLSGVALATYLAKYLQGRNLRYSYRFVFAPATIGSITWLSQNEANLYRIKHGLVAAVVGDSGNSTYKKSRQGIAEIDCAVMHVLEHSGQEYEVIEFSPWGYDERQFCSPGIALDVGRLTRTPNGCYEEYHTSADNLSLVKADKLADSFLKYATVFDILECNKRYINQSPKCEPQLGKRGLYRKTGGHKDVGQHELALLWVLNLSDGAHSLLDIAKRSGLIFSQIRDAAEDLANCGLITAAVDEENSTCRSCN
ncbi:MAG TPA: DUF4910 domain-containing protein [Chromatiales bacterium]|nr:DUF4910 domain-containing protein [Chromatiales bacterium]